MKALLVVAHPRTDSLTARVAARLGEHLTAHGVEVDVLDLHAEGFDPRMTPEDEPDWADRDKVYSAQVRAHMDRISAADLLVVVFPVWWFAPPAVLKGWIDRVWNHGFAYGRSQPRLAGKRMWWIGLAGESAETFAEHGMAEVLDRQLRVGVSNYCGITDASVTLLHGTLAGEDHVRALLAGVTDLVDVGGRVGS
ncbi:putative NADPH-quinone reductase [Saccharothrix carnea]|uniref:Putative NADPH-quinone reductase n=1 Tax=Saccharothrix carnea TaxID=1280637 RepID=A0A2P8IG46_SACCR|nr:NAD(P)H oxidoreductase [Saccharothrix carnea]PSL57420.1 putative NADPH-quinone reductase [Saccharothrix carnea]